MTKPKIEATYDPALARYRVHCPLCDHFAVRAKKEAAIHVISQHLAYVHEADLNA